MFIFASKQKINEFYCENKSIHLISVSHIDDLCFRKIHAYAPILIEKHHREGLGYGNWASLYYKKMYKKVCQFYVGNEEQVYSHD